MSETRLRLTAQDSGKAFLLQPGDEIQVDLLECCSGGYQWAAEGPETDILRLIRVDEGRASSDAPGAAATRTFLFQAGTPGACRVQLKQWQSWEGDASVIERFDAQVEVRAASV